MTYVGKVGELVLPRTSFLLLTLQELAAMKAAYKAPEVDGDEIKPEVVITDKTKKKRNNIFGR
jgi:hypothetical protein